MSSPGGLRRLQRSAVPLFLASFVAGAAYAVRSQEQLRVRLAWQDVAVFHDALRARGIDRGGFDAYIDRVSRTNVERVREGDLDHLVFYLLQSQRFTERPRIEPAESAKALVDSLSAREREAFVAGGSLTPSQVPPAVRERAAALLHALDGAGAAEDARLAYFRDLVRAALPAGQRREAALLDEYVRAMRFLYQQEFVARQSTDAPSAVRGLYQLRGLSTDTAVEAGYLVYLGLGMLRGLDPDRVIRRVLIVGPGLDLAPRTALADERPPESYQPWAVIDALLALGLSNIDSLQVVAADINPRVVAHLRRARAAPPVLTLLSEIAGAEGVTLADDYREYFAQLGRAIGGVEALGATGPGASAALGKIVRVQPGAAAVLRPGRLDIVTERLDERFDLVIATNVLPYFDDVQLMLAMSNVGAMLAPGGVFLHNEGRPVLGEITDALGFPFERSRHAIIATVRGATAPLGDSVWLHRKRQGR